MVPGDAIRAMQSSLERRFGETMSTKKKGGKVDKNATMGVKGSVQVIAAAIHHQCYRVLGAVSCHRQSDVGVRVPLCG